MITGSKNGFIDWEVFKSDKEGDYHTCMDSEHYFEFIKQLAPKLPSKCVLIVDRATYHMELTGRVNT